MGRHAGNIWFVRRLGLVAGGRDGTVLIGVSVVVGVAFWASGSAVGGAVGDAGDGGAGGGTSVGGVGSIAVDGVSSLSSSISTGCWRYGVMLLTRGEGTRTCWSPLRCARIWPLTVASDRGGNWRSCLTVNEGNVVRYPAWSALARVSRVGEKRDAW